MIKVDLVTGFLGAGKTTFIREYVNFLTSKGEKIGVIENDFGAINVDMLSLQDLQTDLCEVEQLVGTNVDSDWKRRFKAKLISMAMRGFKRIVVEPSGIYDVDLFFDMLYDDPLTNWYEPGSVISIVDVNLTISSDQMEYYLVSQTANAASILLSKIDSAGSNKISDTVLQINKSLEKFGCNRKIDDSVISKQFVDYDSSDFEKIASSGFIKADHKKLWFDKNDLYSSIFFFDVSMTENDLVNAIRDIFNNEKVGYIHRIKGFMEKSDSNWLEYNATPTTLSTRIVPVGQSVMIIIGENIDKELIATYLQFKNE